MWAFMRSSWINALLTFIVIPAIVLSGCCKRGEEMDYMMELAAIAKEHGGNHSNQGCGATWNFKSDAL